MIGKHYKRENFIWLKKHPYQGCALPTELQQRRSGFYLNEGGFARYFE